MTLDLESAVLERNRITCSFGAPIGPTRLIATDITDHRHWFVEVYRKVPIHEACVFDDCRRRFEKAFNRWN